MSRCGSGWRCSVCPQACTSSALIYIWPSECPGCPIDECWFMFRKVRGKLSVGARSARDSHG
eukprot:7434946-Pyramimonas_sp.AAC.1